MTAPVLGHQAKFQIFGGWDGQERCGSPPAIGRKADKLPKRGAPEGWSNENGSENSGDVAEPHTDNSSGTLRVNRGET